MESSLNDTIILTRGICIGAIALVLARSINVIRSRPSAKWLLIYSVSLLAYCLAPLTYQIEIIGPLVVWVSVFVPPTFWLFCRSLFEDLSDAELITPVTQIVMSLYLVVVTLRVGQFDAEDGMFTETAFYLSYIFHFGFVTLAVLSLIRSGSDDLIQPRRTLRSLILATSAIYIAIVLTVEVIFANTRTPMALEALHSIALVIVFVGFAIWFVVLAPQELLAAKSGEPNRTTSPKFSPQLERLQELMESDKVYRDHELSIGKLARHMGIPEHQLRALINQQLGHRNFREFVNGYRIEEAAERLTSPADAHNPILTIALDVGFGSIAPFNRAFKARFGLSPSNYRANKPSQTTET